MSESIREEFEAWAMSRGWGRSHLKQTDTGAYEDWGVNPEWLSWQASRAALCVELLDTVANTGTLTSTAVLGYKRECREAIHAAGVKTK
jgi:hypothetical protein